MVMYGTCLSDLPADRDQLVERRLVNQVAGIVLAVPGEIRRERLGVQRRILHESAKSLRLIKSHFGKLAEFCDKMFDGNLLYRSGHGMLPEKYNAAGASEQGCFKEHCSTMFD